MIFVIDILILIIGFLLGTLCFAHFITLHILSGEPLRWGDDKYYVFTEVKKDE